MSGAGRIPLVPALEAIRARREPGDVVISAMGAAREWMAMGSHPLDWVFVPSSMGQAPSLGLGLALARPDRRIIVLNGDGGMLMNLGALVTITACAPENLITLVFDNGIYEVTGGQPTPGAPQGRRSASFADFPGLARASGFESVFHFRELEEFRQSLNRIWAARGPVFVALDVIPMPDAAGPRSPGPAPARARNFMEALADS